MKGLKSIIKILIKILISTIIKNRTNRIIENNSFFFIYISKPINQKSSHAIMKITRETSIDHAEDRVTVTRSSIETLNNKYRAKYRRYNQRMHQSSRCYKSKKNKKK